MWCWRRMEKISWIDYVRNEKVLLRVNEQRNILRDIRKRKANWIGHILRRNCLLKQVIEGKIKGEMDVTRRRGRRRRSCWMTLRTGEDTPIWRRRLWIALCGGIFLEEALDLSSDRLLNNNNKCQYFHISCRCFSVRGPVSLPLTTHNHVAARYCVFLQKRQVAKNFSVTFFFFRFWHVCVY